ncbi:MAG: histone H1 [Mucilaginibacter sp.]|uniref:histone H1 n=1 Tax=Mucilaginibacter sp. TaxID=1882438 RepID=UPI0032654A81
MKTFQALKELINTAEADAVKFYEKENKIAGVRLRKSLLQVKSLAQDIRKEVTGLKTKSA